jgi:hypothetical protein
MERFRFGDRPNSCWTDRENGDMNQNCQHQLKLHVERIVRPIIARESDKLTMRQELYAHLVAAVEQEMTHDSSEGAAVQRATERLGIFDTVREELQSAVSWQSRVDSFFERFSRRPNGSFPLMHAAKMGLAFGAGGVACLLVVMATPYVFGVEKCDGQQCTVQSLSDVWPRMLFAGMRMFPFLFLATFNASLLATAVWEGVTRTPARSRTCWLLFRQSIVVLLALCGQCAAIVFVSHLGEGAPAHALEQFIDLLFWCSFFTTLAAVAVLPLAWLNARKQRQYAEWIELDLDETVAE